MGRVAETVVRGDRRWMLAAAAGAGLGLVAASPPAAEGATGDPVILGGSNESFDTTGIIGDVSIGRDHATINEAALTVANGDSGGIFAQADNDYGIRAVGYPAAQIEGQFAGKFAGTLTVAAGASRAVHSMPYSSNISQSMFGVTLVVASLQQYRAGVHVAACVVTRIAPVTFTVYLNQAVSVATRVGFVVIN